MNTIESFNTTSPFGTADDCAMITVVDLSQAYVIPTVMTIGKEYTISFWVKSDNGGSLMICGSNLETPTSKWEKKVVTFTANMRDLAFLFGNTDTYYLYRIKLEIGNKATDWTPAPEDVDQSIADVNENVNRRIIDQTTSIIQTCEGIVLSAGKKYVDTSAYKEFRKEVQAKLSVVSNEIAMEFNTAQKEMGLLSDRYSELSKRIAFTQDGIAISAGESAMTLHIDNDIIMFEKDGVPFGRWTPDNFNTSNIRVEVEERAQFGNFAFVPRSDGSLSFLKVEHNTKFYARHSGNILFIYGAHPTLDDNMLIIEPDDIPSELDGTTLLLGGS